MNKTGIVIILLCFLAAAAVVLWERRKTRKTMEEIERMLDAAMTGSFSETNFDESRLSALETKFAHYLSAAEASSQNIAQEKDKIKTLIADISHQTKTPIANLLLYSELLMEETIIGLVGLLNFFNAMMTSILSRRREFAVLQAVGMTNRQLKTMLIYEGLFYAMSSVSAAFILSLAVGPLAGKMLGSMFWFFEYRFTILPVLLTIPVFLLLGWLIPCMMYDNAAKCSVVEQLRDAQ